MQRLRRLLPAQRCGTEPRASRFERGPQGFANRFPTLTCCPRLDFIHAATDLRTPKVSGIFICLFEALNELTCHASSIGSLEGQGLLQDAGWIGHANFLALAAIGGQIHRGFPKARRTSRHQCATSAPAPAWMARRSYPNAAWNSSLASNDDRLFSVGPAIHASIRSFVSSSAGWNT